MNSSSFPLLAVVLISAAALHAQSPALRTWTSADGRKMEAAFVTLEGDAVKVRLANGSTVDVPLARLSAADQTFAKSQTATPAASSTAPGEVAASKIWPRSFSLPDRPEVVVVKEDSEKNEYIYRSPHYEFQCDSKLGSNVVREFGRIFESTWMLNCMLPLDLKPQPEKLREIFLARLFTQKSDYMEAGGIEGSAGVYMSGKKALMVPLQSLGVKMVGSRVSLENNSDDDMATLIHEITHQMMNHWLGRLPTWYIEGSAEYVEMLEYKRNGGFSLIGLGRQLQGYARRMNYSGGGKSFTMIDLEELMTIDGRRWAAALGQNGAATENYGSAGLLTYYFYHLDGNGDAANIIAYLRELENAKTNEEEQAAVKKHLMRERTYAQLGEDVKKALRKEGIDISFFSPGKNGPASSTN
ncbi:MAG: SHD1 domain-containing protein [Verrucomicrobia bacterium]|nr:SHD1 domain-containing protein [Verrucomicrobiota bacterium]